MVAVVALMTWDWISKSVSKGTENGIDKWTVYLGVGITDAFLKRLTQYGGFSMPLGIAGC